jgi:hypothetical protein
MWTICATRVMQDATHHTSLFITSSHGSLCQPLASYAKLHKKKKTVWLNRIPIFSTNCPASEADLVPFLPLAYEEHTPLHVRCPRVNEVPIVNRPTGGRQARQGRKMHSKILLQLVIVA